MFRNRLHGDYLPWYLSSPHKERMDLVGEALLVKGYRCPVVQNHVLEWIRLSRYLSNHSLPLPSTVSCKEIDDHLRARFPEGSVTRRRGIRAAIRIFLEADDCGEFPRRLRPPRPSPPLLYQQWIPPYFHHLRQCRNVSESTLRHRDILLRRFIEFSARSGVGCAGDLSHQIVFESFNDLAGWGQEMRFSYASALRGFLRWGFSEKLFVRDLSGAVMSARRYNDARIPDVLSDEEVDRILGSVDRNTALGKRNYAILLLAARYGLRPCDIRHLCLENMRWREGLIALTQSKTATPLLLPLLEDVAMALLDYLKNGRPCTDSRRFFVRHLAPYEDFSEHNNLAAIMQTTLTKAGMNDRRGLHGMRLFRHSLATRLLREGNPIKTIADVLGHRDISSTFIYTKVDLDELRTVAISIKEVLS